MKLHKKIITVACVLALACSANVLPAPHPSIPIQVEAATTKTITISKTAIQKKGASTAIQDALNTAKKKASAKKTYTIVVPKGTYTLKHSLYIFSNTELKLNGVTLIAAKGKNAIHVGTLDSDHTGATGYCYKNIKISGGVLDGKHKSGTLVKVGHAANFTMTGVTVKNTKNAHLMETAGVKGLTVKKCKFKNQVSTAKEFPYYEAIQLDVLYPKHMPGYRAETLNTSNVMIENCTFSDVPRGVGSHTAILNQKMDNIVIRKCTFSNTSSVAIQGLNWKNCTIEHNTITNSPRGICYYDTVTNGTGTYLPSVVAKIGKTKTSLKDKYIAPTKDQNIVIFNNNITLNEKKDPFTDYDRVAILISGAEITTKNKHSDQSGNLPVGNYYPSGITVNDNVICTTGYGMRCVNAHNSTVKNNTITFQKPSDNGSYYGIQIMNDSKSIRVLSNTIKQAITNGIYVNRNSEVTEIANNIILGTGKYGIDIEASIAKSITGNEISDTQMKGIFIYDGATTELISQNKLTSTGDTGIHVCSSTAQYINNNTITNPGRFGIMYSSKSQGTLISNNTIQNATTKNIHIANDSSVNY